MMGKLRKRILDKSFKSLFLDGRIEEFPDNMYWKIQHIIKGIIPIRKTPTTVSLSKTFELNLNS